MIKAVLVAVAVACCFGQEFTGTWSQLCLDARCAEPGTQSCTESPSVCSSQCYVAADHVCCGCAGPDDCNVCAGKDAVCLGKGRADGCDNAGSLLPIVGGAVGGILFLCSVVAAVVGAVLWKQTEAPQPRQPTTGSYGMSRSYAGRSRRATRSRSEAPPPARPPLQQMFSCPTCQKGYPTPEDLAFHVSCRHGVGSSTSPVGFACPECAKLYPSAQDVRLHVELRHPNR